MRKWVWISSLEHDEFEGWKIWTYTLYDDLKSCINERYPSANYDHLLWYIFNKLVKNGFRFQILSITKILRGQQILTDGKWAMDDTMNPFQHTIDWSETHEEWGLDLKSWTRWKILFLDLNEANIQKIEKIESWENIFGQITLFWQMRNGRWRPQSWPMGLYLFDWLEMSLRFKILSTMRKFLFRFERSVLIQILKLKALERCPRRRKGQINAMQISRENGWYVKTSVNKIRGKAFIWHLFSSMWTKRLDRNSRSKGLKKSAWGRESNGCWKMWTSNCAG